MSKIDYADPANFVEVDKIIAEVLKLSDDELMRQHSELRCEQLQSYGLQYVLVEVNDIRSQCIVNISNENSMIAGKVPFRMQIPPEIYFNRSSLPMMSTERWEKRITLAAARSGVKSLSQFVTASKYEELVGNNDVMAATAVNEIAPGLTVVTIPDAVTLAAPGANAVNFKLSDGLKVHSTGVIATDIGVVPDRRWNIAPDGSNGVISNNDLDHINASLLVPNVIPIKELTIDKILQAMKAAGINSHFSRGEFIMSANEEELKNFAKEVQKQANVLK